MCSSDLFLVLCLESHYQTQGHLDFSPMLSPRSFAKKSIEKGETLKGAMRSKKFVFRIEDTGAMFVYAAGNNPIEEINMRDREVDGGGSRRKREILSDWTLQC